MGKTPTGLGGRDSGVIGDGDAVGSGRCKGQLAVVETGGCRAAQLGIENPEKGRRRRGDTVDRHGRTGEDNIGPGLDHAGSVCHGDRRPPRKPGNRALERLTDIAACETGRCRHCGVGVVSTVQLISRMRHQLGQPFGRCGSLDIPELDQALDLA